MTTSERLERTCRCPVPPGRGRVCRRCGRRCFRRQTPGPVSFVEARAADGPRVIAWLEERGFRLPRARDELLARRVSAWRAGGSASFYTLDELLTGLGVHPSELPDDVWLAGERPRRGLEAVGETGTKGRR